MKSVLIPLLMAVASLAGGKAQAQPLQSVSQFDPMVLHVQVLLDRAHQSPGVIDGVMGANTHRAILAYQHDNALPGTGSIDEPLLQSLGVGAGTIMQNYVITEEDVGGPFRAVPATMAGKARLDTTAYGSPAEALAEKFHMSKAFLKELNPGVDFSKAGTSIEVVRPGDSGLPADIARIEVDEKANELRAYSKSGALVATYPTTVGSTIHPSPSDATLRVVAVAPNPTYHFDPAGRSWGPDHELTIAPGPNNPVGVVWIALSRDGFGIHGTPEPRLIGKTSSHGCVRLTNWDAEELSLAVHKGTAVEFM